MPPRNRERNDGMNDKDAVHRRDERLAQLRKDGDALTPEEIAWWKENVAKPAANARPPLPLAQAKLSDAWIYDGERLLSELADVREMILRIPPLPTNASDQTEYYTLTNRSRIQSAIDRIWRLEEDLRFLLTLNRDRQRDFAKHHKAAQKATAHKGKEKIAAGSVVKMAKFKT
jgi:hypothetical protein